MEIAIIEAIAVNSAFGTDEVKEAYDLYKSYDLIVSACEFARVMGYSNLVTACRKLQYG